MFINMSPCGSTLEEQLLSIMDTLAKAAVSEICQLFSDGSATLRLQITRSLKENEALKTRMKVMKRELLSLRFQTRSNASSAASRLAPAQANICRPRTEPLGNEDGDDFEGCSTQLGATSESQSNCQKNSDDLRDCSTQLGATSESLHVDTHGSFYMSSHSEELRIVSVHGKGEGPLSADGQDTLLAASEVEVLYSLSADHSMAKSLEGGEQLVCCEELTVQQTPDTILIKDEEGIGGGMPAVDCDDFGDCSTQHGTTSESLHVDAPGSSHMSSHSEEQRILSVDGKGEGPLVVDGHDNCFTASEVEALSSLSADHSVAKSLVRGKWLVHLEELPGHLGGRKGRPCVSFGKGFPDNTIPDKMTIDMCTHTGEKPYGCDQSMKCFQRKGSLKHQMRTLPGERPYRCDQCMKLFRTSYQLKFHLRIHSGEKPYRCDQCMKSFGRSSSFETHIRTHSVEKPYRCDQCMKSFSRSSSFETHMRTHSGERPYRCDQCTMRFNQRAHLKLHMRTHSGEKPYRCDHCTKSFSRSSSRKIHMRTHSEEKPYVV